VTVIEGIPPVVMLEISVPGGKYPVALTAKPGWKPEGLDDKLIVFEPAIGTPVIVLVGQAAPFTYSPPPPSVGEAKPATTTYVGGVAPHVCPFKAVLHVPPLTTQSRY
jgi:hypothetical protein